MEKIDFFICHASEDKNEFVRPLAHYIIKNGAKVFYDEFSIRLGDSLSEKINQGLSQCNCAIVVLSKYFFTKTWTNAELQAIFQRHITKKSKLIILYHQITHEEVLEALPLLADIYAADTSDGIPSIASKIFKSVKFQPSLKYLTVDLSSSSPNIPREGFHAALGLQFNCLSDPYVDKYIVEYGDPDAPFGRISLFIRGNQFLVASFTDLAGRSISLQTQIEPFIDAPTLVVAQISVARRAIELYTEGQLVASLPEVPTSFLNGFQPTPSSIICNSFDLVHPTPMTLSFHSTGSEFTQDQISSLSKHLKVFASALDNAIRDAQHQDAEDGR